MKANDYVVIETSVLSDVDDLLAHLEDFIKGNDGHLITVCRGKLNKVKTLSPLLGDAFDVGVGAGFMANSLVMKMAETNSTKEDYLNKEIKP